MMFFLWCLTSVALCKSVGFTLLSLIPFRVFQVFKSFLTPNGTKLYRVKLKTVMLRRYIIQIARTTDWLFVWAALRDESPTREDESMGTEEIWGVGGLSPTLSPLLCSQNAACHQSWTLCQLCAHCAAGGLIWSVPSGLMRAKREEEEGEGDFGSV